MNDDLIAALEALRDTLPDDCTFTEGYMDKAISLVRNKPPADGFTVEQYLKALEKTDAENSRLREVLLRLANAADDVGVKFFDTDTMLNTVVGMQNATLNARKALAALQTPPVSGDVPARESSALQLRDEFVRRMNAIPLGDENSQRGASSYNWGRYHITVIDEILTQMNLIQAEKPKADDRREAGELLPKDVKIGSVVFRKGVELDTLINAASRWYAMVKDKDSCLSNLQNKFDSLYVTMKIIEQRGEPEDEAVSLAKQALAEIEATRPKAEEGGQS